ncbi:MAG: polysaccharide deacetylase family protein [Sphingobacteriales bacterium]|nr:MAG: polysaccharide deacetylase family protein [Sphingobacteriales bacterium]
MSFYWVRNPSWLRRLFPPQLVWSMPSTGEPAVYLTFDDGPHTEHTPFVLDQLEAHQGKGTFFCIGDNVRKYPGVYEEIRKRGHRTGNHTFHHFNGWKTGDSEYINDVGLARELIDSTVFRPPYGRITRRQVQLLTKSADPYSIFMWDVLSGDFDRSISGKQCLQNVLRNIRPGSIVVFHDSDKAAAHLRFALPEVLKHCREQGWEIKKLPENYDNIY